MRCGREARFTSNVPADTAMGFAPSFRFGNPFFLQPNVDELLWRTHVKDNFSIVSGNHTVKFGGEWIHTLNDQVFRGFFTGRYLFDSASPASCVTHRQRAPGGLWTERAGVLATELGYLGPSTLSSWPDWQLVRAAACSILQNGISTGIQAFRRRAHRPSRTKTSAFLCRTSGRCDQTLRSVSVCVGKRRSFPSQWFPQRRQPMASLLSNPNFPSDGTLHSPKKEFQPRVGFAWDIFEEGKSVLRASYGIFLRPTEHVVAGGFDYRQRRATVRYRLRFEFRCSNGSPGPARPGRTSCR